MTRGGGGSGKGLVDHSWNQTSQGIFSSSPLNFSLLCSVPIVHAQWQCDRTPKARHLQPCLTRSLAVAERPRDASCHWIFRYKSLKITQGHSKWHPWVGLFRYDYICILHHFWHNQRQIMAWAWNLGTGRSRSSKMAPLDRPHIRLTVCHCNYSSILYHFRDKTRYWPNIAICSYPLHLRPPLTGSPSEYCHIPFDTEKLYRRWCGYPTMKSLMPLPLRPMAG